MPVRASTLISVQWPPEPISPGPDTLVLSVGTYYVDLRMNRDDGSIYWALAGRRIVVSEEPRKVKFTHEIDSHDTTTNDNTESKEAGEEEVADEGTFTKLPNGDDLEIGEMPAPHLGGKVAAYREVWRELNAFDNDIKNEDDRVCWMLESVEVPEEKQERKEKKRAFYCRVGRFFLALRRAETRVSDDDPKAVEVEFSGIRQEFEGREWVTKYSVGTEADDMLHMSTSKFVLENVKGEDSAWKVDDQVVIINKKDGTVREACVVRAVK